MIVEHVNVNPNVYLHYENSKQELNDSKKIHYSEFSVSYLLTKYLCILRYVSAKQERIKKAGYEFHCNDTNILYYYEYKIIYIISIKYLF